MIKMSTRVLVLPMLLHARLVASRKENTGKTCTIESGPLEAGCLGWARLPHFFCKLSNLKFEPRIVSVVLFFFYSFISL